MRSLREEMTKEISSENSEDWPTLAKSEMGFYSAVYCVHVHGAWV